MIEITRTWQGPAIEADLAFRREHLIDELGTSRRAAYRSRAARAERAAQEDVRRQPAAGPRAWLRRWSLRGSGAWHTAR